MSTTAVEKYNEMVQNSMVEMANVVNVSITGDAPAIADPQLTSEARFEQVKNALYGSLDKAGAFALTRAEDIAITTGSKISENYWRTVANSFDTWKLNVTSASSIDAVVDSFTKNAARTFQWPSKKAPGMVGLTSTLSQAGDTLLNSSDYSEISDALGLMSMTVASLAIAEHILEGAAFFTGLL